MSAATGFTPVQQFILDALHADKPVPEAGMDDVAWQQLASLARMHRLGPMLHYRLGRSDGVPPSLRTRWQDSRDRHTRRNLKIYGELIGVTQLLAAAGIPFLALKGAWLARYAYPEAGLRPMRDLDLLLRPDDALAAFRLLQQHGYTSVFGGSPEAYFADRIHLPPLRSPGGIMIELHHRLTSPDAGAITFEDNVWQGSISREIGGLSVAFPGPEAMLLHLCIHATHDHYLNIGPLALLDVQFLIEAARPDWQRFLRQVREGGWQRHVLPVLLLAQRHVGAEVPGDVIAALQDEGDDGWLSSAEQLLFSDPEDHKLLAYDVQEMLYGGSFSGRLGRVMGAIFPSRTVIARHFPVDADSARVFLYLPHHWYRLVSTKLPTLFASLKGDQGGLRRLAAHRDVFGRWLEDKPTGNNKS